MSEKHQRNAANTRGKMVRHYSRVDLHKHNKYHLPFGPRQLHPNPDPEQGPMQLIDGHENWTEKDRLRAKQRKTRTRFNKGSYH